MVASEYERVNEFDGETRNQNEKSEDRGSARGSREEDGGLHMLFLLHS